MLRLTNHFSDSTSSSSIINQLQADSKESKESKLPIEPRTMDIPKVPKIYDELRNANPRSEEQWEAIESEYIDFIPRSISNYDAVCRGVRRLSREAEFRSEKVTKLLMKINKSEDLSPIVDWLKLFYLTGLLHRSCEDEIMFNPPLNEELLEDIVQRFMTKPNEIPAIFNTLYILQRSKADPHIIKNLYDIDFRHIDLISKVLERLKESRLCIPRFMHAIFLHGDELHMAAFLQRIMTMPILTYDTFNNELKIREGRWKKILSMNQKKILSIKKTATSEPISDSSSYELKEVKLPKATSIAIETMENVILLPQMMMQQDFDFNHDEDRKEEVQNPDLVPIAVPPPLQEGELKSESIPDYRHLIPHDSPHYKHLVSEFNQLTLQGFLTEALARFLVQHAKDAAAIATGFMLYSDVLRMEEKDLLIQKMIENYNPDRPKKFAFFLQLYYCFKNNYHFDDSHLFYLIHHYCSHGELLNEVLERVKQKSLIPCYSDPNEDKPNLLYKILFSYPNMKVYIFERILGVSFDDLTADYINEIIVDAGRKSQNEQNSKKLTYEFFTGKTQNSSSLSSVPKAILPNEMVDLVYSYMK